MNMSASNEKFLTKRIIEETYGKRGLRPILKPCRFCGSTKVVVCEDSLNPKADPDELFYAQCVHCKHRSKGEDSMFWAILQWNSEQEEKVECLQPDELALNVGSHN